MEHGVAMDLYYDAIIQTSMIGGIVIEHLAVV